MKRLLLAVGEGEITGFDRTTDGDGSGGGSDGAVYPGVCILLTVLCFNVLGNGFRRRFSPNSGR